MKNAMNLRTFAIAVLCSSCLFWPKPSRADNSLNQLLQQSICGQNWFQAVRILTEMKRLAPQDAARLTVYQSRLQTLADRNIFITGWDCSDPLPTASAAQPAAAQGDGFTIPIIDRNNGIPVVSVTFNGETVPMLFDTGASSTMILPSLAARINPTILGQAFVTVADGRVVPSLYGTVAEVQVGNLSLDTVEVTFSEGVDELALGGMGLLGQNVYGSYDVTIKENVIELRSRNAPTPE
jgi:aspartyl protease family protein